MDAITDDNFQRSFIIVEDFHFQPGLWLKRKFISPWFDGHYLSAPGSIAYDIIEFLHLSISE